ncbi:hypothetical protein [Pseudomonas xionganensis]|uniref:Uncharacterized protein n=1 Tax=Pseudomonas xionganensis TaxID=2654845 RepID=A0A6I4KTF9_9PSED|nr:hypothetical protein [Pseudomonas xionganensis]MVW75364.1 hypothetical protein [Pseudomonas xionganensis]
MSAKAAAPALIVAAMALVGDYSAAAEGANQARPTQHQAAPFKQEDIRSVIAKMVSDWTALDADYVKIVSSLVEFSRFDEEQFLKNMQLLKATRQLETALQQAAVPEILSSEHMALRRAIAKVRGRLVTVDHLFRQHFVVPDEYQSALPGKALSDLADHTNRQLAKLA